MIELQTPRGLSVNVPETRDEDQSPHFEAHDRKAIAEYYAANGYVIVRDVVSQRDCDRIRQLWEQEVKPNRGFMYRQATAKAERHETNARGWIIGNMSVGSIFRKGRPSLKAFLRKSSIY